MKRYFAALRFILFSIGSLCGLVDNSIAQQPNVQLLVSPDLSSKRKLAQEATEDNTLVRRSPVRVDFEVLRAIKAAASRKDRSANVVQVQFFGDKSIQLRILESKPDHYNPGLTWFSVEVVNDAEAKAALNETPEGIYVSVRTRAREYRVQFRDGVYISHEYDYSQIRPSRGVSNSGLADARDQSGSKGPSSLLSWSLSRTNELGPINA